MSRTEMYAVEPGGDVVSFASFQNSHGGAMAVWRLLTERYFAGDGGASFIRMLESGLKELFALARHGKLEPWETVVLMTTCDNVLIPIEHVESVASAFEEFDTHYGPEQQARGLVFSIPAQARELRRMLEEREEKGWRGVCWNQTSVNGDALWYGVSTEGDDAEGDAEDEDDEGYRPYNVDKDSSHWIWPESKSDVED